MEFAVSAGAVAIPLAFVVAVTVANPLKAPLAPVVGAVNVTVMPLNGLLPASFTTTCRVIVNAALIATLCGVPAVGVTLDGGPVMLDSVKLAGADTPVTLAVIA